MGDAGAYSVYDMITRPAAPWPGSVGAVPQSAADGDGRVVISKIKQIHAVRQIY